MSLQVSQGDQSTGKENTNTRPGLSDILASTSGLTSSGQLDTPSRSNILGPSRLANRSHPLDIPESASDGLEKSRTLQQGPFVFQESRDCVIDRRQGLGHHSADDVAERESAADHARGASLDQVEGGDFTYPSNQVTEEAAQIGDADEPDEQSFATAQPPLELEPLPFHILAHIASVLPRQDLLSFACCSKKIRDIAQSPSTWRLIYQSHPGWRIREPIHAVTPRAPEFYDSCDEFKHSALDWPTMVREREKLEQRWRDGNGSMAMHAFPISRLAIYCVFFLEDIIITGGKDHTVTFWHLDGETYDLRCLTRFPKAHDGSVLCIVVDTEWRHQTGLMISGGSDGMIKVWDLDGGLFKWDEKKTKPRQLRVLGGHAGGVLDLALCDRRFYSCSKDGTIRVWCKVTFNSISVIDPGIGPLNCIAIHDSKLYLAVSNHRGQIILFDIELVQLIKKYHTKNFEAIACLGFCDDILFYGDTSVKGLDITTWQIIVHPMQPVVHPRQTNSHLVRAMVTNPGLRRVVTGNYTGSIRDVVRSHSFKAPGRIFALSMSATKIVAGDDTGTLIVQDCKSKRFTSLCDWLADRPHHVVADGYDLTYRAYFA